LTETHKTREPLRDATPRVAIACQGGGALAAFTAGVLKRLITPDLTSEFQLGGLSGASGGAITACVAWAELLKNGPARVGQALDSFWKDNSAYYPWEVLSNAALVAAASGIVEITLSPYMFPLAFLEAAAKLVAPRKEFVDLETLIRLHIPVEELGILARFQALSPALENWLIGVDGRDLGLSYVNGETAPPDPELIRWVAADTRQLDWAVLKPHVIAHGLERIEAIARQLNGSPLAPSAAHEILSILRIINSEVPVLLAGAVNALSGDFKAFNSAHGELDLNALLASSAVPWAFKAVEGKYWDGLYSQNPPVRNLLTDAPTVEEKPDEIWIVQLASQESTEPVTAPEIVTRRLELSSNLSLNQELAAIRALNRRMTQGVLQDASCKLIAIHWIRLDQGFLRRSGLTEAPSMVDRDPKYIQALINHGFDLANAFLPARAFVEEIWNQADLKRRQAAERRWCGSGAEPALEIIEAMHRDLDRLHIDVDGMDIGCTNVTFSWTACGLHRQTTKFVVLQGNASLRVADNFVQYALIQDVRFEAVGSQ
jgi:predicted acylesterase/phospholipase RssA